MNFRSDRFAALYLVRPLRRDGSAPATSVPILMYHSISEQPESGVHPYYRTSTSPQQFAVQMKYLFDQGYRTASLAETVSALRGEAGLEKSQRRFVITFDDGYRDFYEQAFPVLQRHDFSATVFLPTAFIGDTSLPFKGKDCLTWAEVRELNRHGIVFGSHTVNHPQLHDTSVPVMEEEVTKSKNTIEEKLGCAVDSFAYPYAFPQTDGDFKKALRDILLSAGYQNGVCTTVGRANRRSEALFLERLPANGCDDEALLQAKLDGAYDWIGDLQYAAKMGKAWLRNPFRAKSVISHPVSFGA